MTSMMILVAAQASSPNQWGHAGGWWVPFTLLFWGGVAAIVAYLVVHVRPPRQRSGADRARDILAERLARGEISSEDYFERLSSLS